MFRFFRGFFRNFLRFGSFLRLRRLSRRLLCHGLSSLSPRLSRQIHGDCNAHGAHTKRQLCKTDLFRQTCVRCRQKTRILSRYDSSTAFGMEKISCNDWLYRTFSMEPPPSRTRSTKSSCGPLSTHTSRPAWNSNTGASMAPHMSGLSTARESAIAWFAQSKVAALVWHDLSVKRCLWNQRMRASEAPL